MEDLHKTLSYISQRLTKTYSSKEYVPIESDCRILKQENYWIKRFLLNVNINDTEYNLILGIPKTFPYEFPSIYVHKDNESLIGLPHIDKNRFICTFDKNVATPNIYNPLGICENVINRAIKIIKEGTSKKNYKDYEEEFLAYWAAEKINYEIISIVKPLSSVKDVCVFDIRELKFKNYSYLIADSLNEGNNWISNSGISKSGKIVNYEYGVYFPIVNAKFDMIPKCNRDIYTFLLGNKLKELFQHLNNKKRPTIVLCNYKNAMFAFGLQEYKDIIQKGKDILKIKHQKGFRLGKQITSLELGTFAKDNPIKRYCVDRFDKERLFERGGEGLNVNQNFKINLFGCGSIGSFLLEKLVQMGFNNFNIVDNEQFSVENLARHICDIHDINEWKSIALKNKMFKHYPLLNIETYTDNIITLTINNISLFNNADLNILCLGNYNIELLISKLLQNQKILKPILIIWVEPYLNAGHFIYLTNDNLFSYENLHKLENGNLKYKYALNSDYKTINKQEVGCQSIYTPYSTINISSFVNYISYLIQEISNGHINQSCVYRWTKGENILESKMEKLL